MDRSRDSISIEGMQSLGLDREGVERFLGKISYSDDCWIYSGGGIPSGYGMFWLNEFGNNRGAHIVSYALFKGPIPDGLYVCHKCDVRRCVNPDHLFLGTTQDNMDDMKEKGRQKRCVDNFKAKLTERDVREIRLAYSSGKKNMPQLSRDYGVWAGTIWQVVNRITWKHVE